MFKPNKTLASIIKPLAKMKTDLEAFIADQRDQRQLFFPLNDN